MILASCFGTYEENDIVCHGPPRCEQYQMCRATHYYCEHHGKHLSDLLNYTLNDKNKIKYITFKNTDLAHKEILKFNYSRISTGYPSDQFNYKKRVYRKRIFKSCHKGWTRPERRLVTAWRSSLLKHLDSNRMLILPPNVASTGSMIEYQDGIKNIIYALNFKQKIIIARLMHPRNINLGYINIRIYMPEFKPFDPGNNLKTKWFKSSKQFSIYDIKTEDQISNIGMMFCRYLSTIGEFTWK